jgi:lipid II:glycine glycyltransferase (peptidoglycan interpeptide bridge formation enzyme)
MDELSSVHPMQSSYWADLKGKTGWEGHAYRLGHSSLLVLTKTFLHLFTLAYVPFGPQETVSLKDLSKDLYRFLPRGTFAIRYDLPYESACDVSGCQIQKESVQPDASVLIDLRKGYTTVVSGYRERARRALKKSKGKVVISRWDHKSADFDAWYDLYVKTAKRDGFSARSKSYMEEVLSDSTEKVSSTLFLAKREGVIVGGTILLSSREEAIYLFGASERMDDCTSSHALQDAMIHAASAKGCDRYDLFGVSGKDGRGSHLASLNLFKTSFGGETLYRPPTCDHIRLHLLHALFTSLENRRYRKQRNA